MSPVARRSGVFVGSIVAAALITLPAPLASAHSSWSGIGRIEGTSAFIDGEVQAGFNGHSSSTFGAFASVRIIANSGSIACGHASQFPTGYMPGARWKVYRNGAFCAQSSLVYAQAPQNSIAIGWDFPWPSRCGGSGNWTDRACGAIKNVYTESCPYISYAIHSF